MTPWRNWLPATLFGALTLPLITACGGGGGSGSDTAPPNPPPPSTTPVSSEGVITGFGSVYVNDVRYELDDDTRVVADGEERRGDDGILRTGMKVSIDATEQDGRRVAESIEHRRDLKGPVTRLLSDPEDPATGTFYVANTRIVTDANTVYGSGFDDRDGNGGIDIRDLTVDNGRLVVAVSGFAAEEGYLATRISRVSGNDDDDDELELKGFVTSVDLDASTFTVSGTTFAVTGATEFGDGLAFDAGLEGAFVEVEGVLMDGMFEAREVEREDDDDDDRDGRFEIEGILVAVDTASSPDTIQIGNRSIEVTDATSLADLVGSKVRVKGTFNAAGVLVIDSTRSREEDERVRTEDRVMSVDAAAGTFTTRLGLVIRPEPTSRLEGDDDDDDERISAEEFLNRLRSNDYVEARGALLDDGSVRWTRIEREDDDDDEEECKLRGPVEAIAADQTSFDILGVTIDVTASRDVEFEDDDDDLSRTEFFDRLEVGMVVNARNDDDDADSCQNGLMLAKEVDLEEDAGPPFGPPPGTPGGGETGGAAGVVFLILDEDSIDNGNPPNDFSAADVNDQLARVGLREPLAWFQDNVGARIDLFTGQVGDEGWFALKTVLSSWQQAGPTDNGVRNYLTPGPGLGGGEDDREVLLDQIPDVTPLRATGISMLRGETVCALVYDGDVSSNYSPLTGNLQGANLGVVGFEVIDAVERTDGSDSDLPRVTIEVRNAAVCDGRLYLFDNAPVPGSSSEPFDIAPPAEPPAPRFVPAT